MTAKLTVKVWLEQKNRKSLTETLQNYACAHLFAGLLPLIPFVIAVSIGGGEGGTSEAVSSWLYKAYYLWVNTLAYIAILISLIAMYVGKMEAFSTKKFWY